VPVFFVVVKRIFKAKMVQLAGDEDMTGAVTVRQPALQGNEPRKYLFQTHHRRICRLLPEVTQHAVMN